jgi:hypothetical protein
MHRRWGIAVGVIIDVPTAAVIRCPPPAGRPDRLASIPAASGLSRVQSSLVNPLRRVTSTSGAPPACDTYDSPPMTTDNQGLRSIRVIN